MGGEGIRHANLIAKPLARRLALAMARRAWHQERKGLPAIAP